MPLRSVLTTTLFLAAGATAFGVFVDRRADLREAGIEARYPAVGRTFTVAGRDVHLTVRGAGPDLVLIHGAGGSNRELRLRLREPSGRTLSRLRRGQAGLRLVGAPA